MQLAMNLWSGVVVSVLTGAVIAQEPGKGAGRGAGAPAARAAVAAEIANTAAAARLVSIRTSLGTMLLDTVLGAAESEQDPETVAIKEEEILKAIAQQLQQFVDQYQDTDDADGARALLARIHVQLNKPADAVRVLHDFDPKRAEKSDLLQAVMSVGRLAELEAKADQWLQVVAADADLAVTRCDAVFVAVRLEKYELADQLLKQIRAAAKTVEQKADVCLAEADLVARLAIRSVVPVQDRAAGVAFLVNPLVAAQLDASKQPVGSWRKVKAVDAAKTKALDDAAKSKLAADEGLRASRVYAQFITDATAGLRIMKALKPFDADIDVDVDDRYIPAADDQPPAVAPPADLVVKGLLHRVVHQFPGTAAARVAATRLDAERLQIGARAVPFDSPTIDGAPVAAADMIGKVVLLDFFAVADADSIAERSRMRSLYDQYTDLGLEIVSICLDVDSDRYLVQAAIDAFDMDWKVVFDGKGPHADLANRYGVQALPARILIGRDGRIAEDRAWKLAPDELANSVEAALRVAVKPLPAADVAYLVEGRYRGPKIDVDVKVADSDASKLQLSADAWVADSNYRLAVAKVETEADIAKVYLRLQLPKQAPTTDTVVVAQDKDVKVQLPKDGICAVKVYVDHKIDDDALKSCPRLLALIPIDPAATLYKGPKIRAQLLSTDSIPPEYSLALVAEVSAAQHAMKVDEIVRSETTTQVKVSLAMLPAGESASPDDSLRLYVPLGVDVAKTIEVLVAKRDSSGRPGTYAVAVKLPRY